MAKRGEIDPKRTRKIARIVEFHKDVKAKRKPNCPEFAAKHGVDARTVARDVDYLRDLGAPLEYDPECQGYFYSDNSWELEAVFAAISKKENTIPNLIKQLKALSPSVLKIVIDTVLQPPTLPSDSPTLMTFVSGEISIHPPIDNKAIKLIEQLIQLSHSELQFVIDSL